MPSERRDGKAWMADGAERAEQANQQIIKAAVAQVEGDWSEFVHTLGLASWRSVVTPCFCCVSDRDHMGSVGDFVRGLSPCPTRTPSDYEQACRDCEVVVRIPDARVQDIVTGTLFFRPEEGWRPRTSVTTRYTRAEVAPR